MMGRLSLYLPPFASDYAGVASALFDLKCMTIIDDASCCTSHYVFYDEPRWKDTVRPVLSTALRTVEAVLGNDERIVTGVTRAAAGIRPSLIALVGTPVPAIVGLDAQGVAAQVEKSCGIPTLGFDTTGFHYYNQGIAMAGMALFDRFAQEGCAPVHGRINVLGMTPLDYGDCGNDADLAAWLQRAGWDVNCRAFMGLSLEQMERAGSASVNLAVSAAGLTMAKHLRERFGTPYVAGFPCGAEQSRLLERRLEQVADGNEAWEEAPAQARDADQAAGTPAKRVLIVGDQVIACSLRESLELRAKEACGGATDARTSAAGPSVDVASFFGWSSALARPQDAPLKDEASYLRLLKEGGYETIVADPLLTDIPAAEHLQKVVVVHPAVSSRLHWQDAVRFIGQGDALLQELR